MEAFTALLRREFVSFIRGPVAFAILTIYTAGLSVAVCVAWPESQAMMGAAGTLARQLSLTLIAALMAACAVCVPALGAMSIVVERQQETFQQLRLTLLTSSEIVLAKVAYVLAFFLVMLTAAMPIGATAFFLVGVDWTQLGMALILILGVGVMGAFLGVHTSTRHTSFFRALVEAFARVILCSVFAPYLFFKVLGLFPYSSQSFLAMLSFCFYVPTLAFSSLRAARRRLDRPEPEPKTDTRPPIDSKAELRRRRRTWPFYLLDPLKRNKPIEDGRNPVYVREWRWDAKARQTLLIRVFYLTSIPFLLPLVLLTILSLLEPHVRFASANTVFFVRLQTWPLVFIGPLFLVSLLTKETECDTLDQLRLTLLRPRDVIRGKFCAGMALLSPLCVPPMISNLLLMVLVRSNSSHFVLSIVGLLLSAAWIVTLALLVGTFTRRTPVALVLVYVFLAPRIIGCLSVFPSVWWYAPERLLLEGVPPGALWAVSLVVRRLLPMALLILWTVHRFDRRFWRAA